MNNDIFFFFYNLAHKSVFFDQIVIFFAIYLPFIVVFLASIFFLKYYKIFSFRILLEKCKDKWYEFLSIFLSLTFAWIIPRFLKVLFHMSRPFLVFPDISPLFLKNTFSFPSEHATFFMALAFSIFFSHKKAGYYFIFLAFIIGISRIIAGVHFPVDILGGFILGFLIAFLFKKV